MSEDEVRRLIDGELKRIVAHEDDSEPLREVHGTRPNRGAVLSVRLSRDELAQLTAEAEREHIPVSTMARKAISVGLNAPDDVEQAVERALRRTLPPELLTAH